jgi:hypothetical protein
MKNKRWVYLYLNGEDNYADAKYTAWPLLRVLRNFKRQYQNWTSIEVRTGDDSETMVSFKGIKPDENETCLEDPKSGPCGHLGCS